MENASRCLPASIYGKKQAADSQKLKGNSIDVKNVFIHTIAFTNSLILAAQRLSDLILVIASAEGCSDTFTASSEPCSTREGDKHCPSKLPIRPACLVVGPTMGTGELVLEPIKDAGWRKSHLRGDKLGLIAEDENSKGGPETRTYSCSQNSKESKAAKTHQILRAKSIRESTPLSNYRGKNDNIT